MWYSFGYLDCLVSAHLPMHLWGTRRVLMQTCEEWNLWQRHTRLSCGFAQVPDLDYTRTIERRNTSRHPWTRVITLSQPSASLSLKAPTGSPGPLWNWEPARMVGSLLGKTSACKGSVTLPSNRLTSVVESPLCRVGGRIHAGLVSRASIIYAPLSTRL